MIYDAAAQVVLDNRGWIDGSALWVFDLRTRAERRLAVDGAEFLGLDAGRQGYFRLIHHKSPDCSVSIRHAGAPEAELARLRIAEDGPRFSGDIGLWSLVDPAVLCLARGGHRLFLIDAARERVAELDLGWFNGESYDLVYQGLAECLALPDGERLIVSVQRCSDLVVLDARRNERCGSIGLAGRHGNPQLRLLPNGDLIASDYDTLCLVDGRALTLTHAARLQGASSSGTRQFLGDLDLAPRGCAVARTFSGDVLLVGLPAFDRLSRAPVPGQPLAICTIEDSAFLTRDWQTGRPTIGRFEIAEHS
jgi:hypothetical protein